MSACEKCGTTEGARLYRDINAYFCDQCVSQPLTRTRGQKPARLRNSAPVAAMATKPAPCATSSAGGERGDSSDVAGDAVLRMDPPHPAQLPHRKVALEASDLLPALIDGDQPRWCCRARIDTYSAILEVDENDEPIRWRGLIPVGDLAALEQQAQRERWHFIPYMATLLLPDVPYGFTMNDGIVLVDAQFETNFCRITTPQQRSKRKAVVK